MEKFNPLVRHLRALAIFLRTITAKGSRLTI
jgi:hypothetical protein